MRDRAHDNLMGLLRRFMDEPAVKAAHEDIQAGERWLKACPAPLPDARVIAAIRKQMTATALRRHRIVQMVRASVAAAAAVIVLALIGLLGPRSASQSARSLASLLPATIWDSDDIMADDRDLAYFSSEIGQIEAQMEALNGDENELGVGAPDELEQELMAIQAEYLKG
jgi:hypothetical protein